MTNDKELERQKDLQRITNAYHRVFGSEDGKAVLANLKAYFRMNRPAFERSLTQRSDPLYLPQAVPAGASRRRHRPTQNDCDPRLIARV